MLSQEDVLHIHIRNPTVGKSTSSAAAPKSATVTTSDGEIPAQKYRPVLKKFSGCNNWPQQSVILPGNEVLFSLETAPDYIKDDKVMTVVMSNTENHTPRTYLKTKYGS